MKNLKSIIATGILAGSLVLGGCGEKKNSEEILAQKEEALIQEEKKLFENGGNKCWPNQKYNGYSADGRYTITNYPTDCYNMLGESVVNEEGDLVVFDDETKRAKMLTKCLGGNKHTLTVFDDYVAFFVEDTSRTYHFQGLYVANYKTGEFQRLASYDPHSKIKVKDKYISFADGGKNIKLVDNPPDPYTYENPLYKK